MKKTNEQVGAILRTVRKIQEDIQSIDRDMEKDRHEIQNIVIRLEALEEESRQTRKAVNTSSERTQDKVIEAITPVIDSTDALTSQVKKTKKIFMTEPRSWFQKLMKRGENK